MLGALCAATVNVVAEDAGGWTEKRNEKGKVVQEMKIQAPSFTEEDQYGYVMPEKYKCDACRAVMYHLNDGLTKRHPKSRKMKQWEYTDVFDEVCRDHFQGYGVKLVNDENTLSGPGIRQEEELAPGSGAIQMGGESWTKRLGEICRKIVYERIGEDELYDMFYAKRFAESKGMETVPEGITESLCSKDLRDCIVGPKKPKADVPAVPARPKPRPRPRKEKTKSKKADTAGDEPKVPTSRLDADNQKWEPIAKEVEEKNRNRRAAEKAAASSAASSDRTDIQTFFRSMAVEHGLTDNEYLTARTQHEWKKLTLAIAGRIFNTAAESGDETCTAK
jgi:hypothetical protein